MESILPPQDVQTFIDELSSSNPQYWKKLTSVISDITNTMMNKLSFVAFCKEESEYLASDVCFVFLENLKNKKLPVFQNIHHLKNYIYKITKNKLQEVFRHKSKQVISIDSIFPLLNDELYIDELYIKKDELNYDSEDVLYKIDLTDSSEVANALVTILFDSEHPLHSQLIRGSEEQIKILFLHEIEEFDYAEIMEKLYENHNDLTKVEKKQKCQNMRQEVHRIKVTLKNRFQNMIEDAQRSRKK